MAEIINIQERLATRRIAANEHEISYLMSTFADLITCDFPSDTKKELVEHAKAMLDDYNMKAAKEGAFGKK